MARQARGEIIDPNEVQIIHCTQRCVRRAFLCGQDPYSGRCYEHRRDWIRQRLKWLASIFGIDCLTYAVMHNHLHIVVRSRPDVVAEWSDDEVARRWLRLFPQRRGKGGLPSEPTVSEIRRLVRQSDVVAERRRRLSDISWWMRCTCENIARRGNAEDDVTGHFWEGRYRSQALLGEAGLLACAAYVDLNPIRAAMAQTPETSDFTGAKDRLDDFRSSADRQRMSTHDWERRQRKASDWLSPLEIAESGDPIGADVSGCVRRASDKGFLSVSLESYLELLDWTGREVRGGKRGVIPKHLQPILRRIGLNGSTWCELITHFGRRYKRAVGTAGELAAEATRRGRSWLQAPGNPLRSVA
jgi:hypothetical protein